MSDYIQTSNKKTARMQILVCGLFFLAFSFVYLYVFQRDVLEALHYSLAHGKTQYAPLASAMTLSVVLLFLRWGTGCLLRLNGKWHAWAYFPSCLILGVLTDVGRGIYTSQYHTSWGWLLPVTLVGYVLVTLLIGRWLRCGRMTEACTSVALLNINLLILLLICLMAACIGNTNRDFHHELQAERYLRQQQYGRVLCVGMRSQKPTHTLTALRAMAMSHEGTMGEKLFQYPQLYKSDGLFFDNDSLKTLRYTNDSLYHLLGVLPYRNEPRMLYLRNICYKGTGKYLALDYYLSALLLDKRISDFRHAVADFYGAHDSLPRYYREALMLCEQAHVFPADSVMCQRFSAFNKRRLLLSGKLEEFKEMKNEFGDTYWWYYHYQK